jgi:hypothetical protein
MSGWYGKGKQRLASGDAAWDTSTYYAVVIDEADYTYARTHADLTSVPAGSRQGTPEALTGKTVNADGELDCDDFTISGLAAGQDTAEAILIYEEAAAADASRYPLLFINGLTIIPNDGDYTFQVEADTPFLGRF